MDELFLVLAYIMSSHCCMCVFDKDTTKMYVICVKYEIQ